MLPVVTVAFGRNGMGKLTKRTIDGLATTSSDYFIWDDDVSGFGVRVWPSGTKTYIAQYRAMGRTRRVKIGNHGALTVEEARREAKGILGDVARGADPQEDRLTKRKSMTIAELCDRYVRAADHGLILGKGGRPKKPSTMYIDRGRIERHIKFLIGKKLVRELSPVDVARFIRDVTSGKSAAIIKTNSVRGKAIVEGGPGAAARTAGLLGGILSFAVTEGVIPFNPARGVKRPADNRRQRRLSAEEYGRLGKALHQAVADRETEQGVHCIWLLALTGCRLGEIVGLRWSEVDEKGGCFRLTDSKEGPSVRPIGEATFKLLAKFPREDGAEYVLPAVRGKGSFGGIARLWPKVMKRAALMEVTPHTLRHSFASVGGDLGYADSTIGAMLGHAGGTVTSRYVHRLDSVLIAAANKVASEVWRQMTAADFGKH